MSDGTSQDQTAADPSDSSVPPIPSDAPIPEEVKNPEPKEPEQTTTEEKSDEVSVPETPPEEKNIPVEEPQPEPVSETLQTPEPPKQEEPKPEEVKPNDVSAETSVKTEETPEPEPSKIPQTTQTDLDTLCEKANKERQDRKQEHLSKVKKLAKSKSINNDEVRELLHVSQTSATRYLEELTRQGKIKKSGKGKATSYSS